MTDEAYDAQTLATSARIERLHRLRFGTQRVTWTCSAGHVNRSSPWHFCGSCAGRAYKDAAFESRRAFALYALADPEELIYSRAN